MKLLPLLLSLFVLVACGGGNEPIASPPTPFIMASVPTPNKKATTVTGGNAVVIHLYQALYGMAPSNALLLDYAFQANNDASTFAKNLTDRFASTSHADLAKLVLDNLGVTPTSVPAVNAKGESEYALLLEAVTQIFGVFPTMRGQVILNMTNLLTGLESDATYGATAAIYNVQARANLAYSSNSTNSSTTASSSQDVTCSVQGNNYGDVSYPSEYLGAFPIPTPTARLPISVARSMAFVDITPLGIDPFRPPSSTCTDQRVYALNLWKETLKRLQLDGASRVVIYGWSGFDDFTKPIWKLDKSAYIPTVDSDLKFVVDEARKRNLEVFYSQQFDYIDLKGNSVDANTITKGDFKKTLDAYHIFIVNQARFNQQIGIAGMGVDYAYPWVSKIFTNEATYDPEFRAMFLNEMNLIIDEIRAVFSGKIVMNTIGTILDNRIAAKVDAIGVTPLIGLLTSDEYKHLTVELLKSKYKAAIEQKYLDISNQIGSTVINLPVIWNLQAQSYANYYDIGWTESAFCSVFPCPQLTYKSDFSIQAIGYEAMLEVVSEQSHFGTNSVNIDVGYWLSDDMVPHFGEHQPGFPNLNQSVRNKPAEGIVRYWFGR